MAEWQLLSLEMDAGGRDIGSFFSQSGYETRRVSLDEFLEQAQRHDDGAALSLDTQFWPEPHIYSKAQLASTMRNLAGNTRKKTLALYGSGFYHHYTYGLCALAGQQSEGFTYIHVDGHTDCIPGWQNHPPGTVIYSNFVEDIVRDTGAKDVIMVGANLGGVPWCTCLQQAIFEDRLNAEEALDDFRGLLEGVQKDVYLSVDLDVTPADECITDWREWERGHLRKGQLLRVVKLLKETKHIIGADILGYTGSPLSCSSRVSFEAMRQRSLSLYRDIVDLLAEPCYRGVE